MDIEIKSPGIDFELHNTYIETRVDEASATLACRHVLNRYLLYLLRLALLLAVCLIGMGGDKLARGRSGGGVLLIGGLGLLLAAGVGWVLYCGFRHLRIDAAGLTTWSQWGPVRWGKRILPASDFERLSVVPTPAGGGTLNLVTRQGPTRLVEADRRVWAERAADTINEWGAKHRP